MPSQPPAPHAFAASADPRIGARTRRGRAMLLWLWLVCASPVIASYLAYYVFTPVGGKAAYGALALPQRPIPAWLRVTDEHGAAIPLASFKGKWLMLSAHGSACDDACARTLFTMRQLRLGLGQDRDRIVPIWLITRGGAIDARLTAAYNNPYAAVRFLRAIDPPQDWLADPASAGSIHLVDPLGNLMMRFPSRPDPKKMRADLARLLKYSRIG